MDLTYEELQFLHLCPLALSPELARLAGDTLATGRKSPLAVRLMLFPYCVVQTVYSVAQFPGIAMPVGGPVFLASWLETKDILHDLGPVLGTTKPGKALLKKWNRLFAETKFFLAMGCLRTLLGAKQPVETPLRELEAIFGDEGPSDHWVKTVAEWRSARCKARFAKWYEERRDALLRKWTNLIDQTDAVWGEHVTVFKGIVAQISGPAEPVPIAAIVGRIPATWQRVQQSAVDHLGKTPEEEWPESQNKFAELLNTNSSTLRKAIEKSPRKSLLRSWDRLKKEWSRNKRRTRSDHPGKPAVISLQDAPELPSDPQDGEEETEVRELLGQHSADELRDILKKLFARLLSQTGKNASEINREWTEFKKDHLGDKERIAKFIVLLRAQHRETFDDDPNPKFRPARRP